MLGDDLWIGAQIEQPPHALDHVEQVLHWSEQAQIELFGDGHFIARAQVNGKSIRMIVDTGASTVVLRPEDARKAGIQVGALDYSVPVETANGRAFAARVKLERVALGELTLEKVEALVTRPCALQQSLLGMSFLSRLRSYEFSGNKLLMKS